MTLDLKEKQMSEAKKCPDCQVAMEEGFIPEVTDNGLHQTH